MRATVCCLGALLVALALSGAAQAQQPFPNGYGNYMQAPAASGPGYSYYNGWGAPYGSAYWPHPPWPPVGTVPPDFSSQQNQQNAPPMFPTHYYARSPRDFFMLDLR